MEVKALSASRLIKWLQCKFKYGCVYHKLIPDQPMVDREYLTMGNAVHEALKCAGALVKEDSLQSFNEEHVDKIVTMYMKKCSRYNIGDAAVIYDGLSLLLNKLEKFEFSHNIILLEERFNIEVAGVPLIGAMDKVVEFDSNTLGVIDYKTSNSVLTDNEIETDIQLSLYDAVARKMFPNYNDYIVCLDYLRFFPKHAKRTEEQRYAFIQLLKANYDLILKATEKDLVPRLNKFCPWCDYVDFCPAIQKIKDNMPEHKIFDTENDLADSYDKIRTLHKILELKLKDIKSVLVKKIREKKTNKAATDDFNIYIRQVPRISYNPIDLYNIIGADDLVKCVNVVNKKLEDLIKSGALSEKEARSISNISYTSEILDVRRKEKQM